jgi:hypothetical protein
MPRRNGVEFRGVEFWIVTAILAVLVIALLTLFARLIGLV